MVLERVKKVVLVGFRILEEVKQLFRLRVIGSVPEVEELVLLSPSLV